MNYINTLLVASYPVIRGQHENKIKHYRIARYKYKIELTILWSLSE